MTLLTFHFLLCFSSFWTTNLSMCSIKTSFLLLLVILTEYLDLREVQEGILSVPHRHAVSFDRSAIFWLNRIPCSIFTIVRQGAELFAANPNLGTRQPLTTLCSVSNSDLLDLLDAVKVAPPPLRVSLLCMAECMLISIKGIRCNMISRIF